MRGDPRGSAANWRRERCPELARRIRRERLCCFAWSSSNRSAVDLRLSDVRVAADKLFCAASTARLEAWAGRGGELSTSSSESTAPSTSTCVPMSCSPSLRSPWGGVVGVADGLSLSWNWLNTRVNAASSCGSCKPRPHTPRKRIHSRASGMVPRLSYRLSERGLRADEGNTGDPHGCVMGFLEPGLLVPVRARNSMGGGCG